MVLSSPLAGGSHPACSKGTVLIIAYAFPPQRIVGALRPYRFARYLPEFGFSTQVITASSPGQTPAPVGVHHVPHFVGDRSRWWRRALIRANAIAHTLVYAGGADQCWSWALSAYRAAESLIAQQPITHVLSTFPPLATHLAALLLKRRHPHLRWAADFRDPLSANPFATSLAAKWDRKLEPMICRAADLIIANTDAAADCLRRLYPGLAPKITHLWNGFDPEDELAPLPIPRRDYKVLAHIGDIYGGRNPHLLLASLERLMQSGRLDPAKIRLQQVGFLDTGSIPDHKLFERMTERGVLILMPRQPQAAAHRIMAESDGLLLIDWAGGLQVPYKLYQYLRIGRPILALTAPQNPAHRILENSGVPCVCLYEQDTAEQVDAKVLRFFNLPSEPRRASDWFFEEFDGRRQAGRLAGMLENLAR